VVEFLEGDRELLKEIEEAIRSTAFPKPQEAEEKKE